MQDLDRLVGSNPSALVSLVEGLRCWWLHMLKAWAVSKKGKKKGRPCSFGHCSETRRSLSILCAWLISMCTRSRGSAPSAKVQIPIVVGKAIHDVGAAVRRGHLWMRTGSKAATR